MAVYNNSTILKVKVLWSGFVEALHAGLQLNRDVMIEFSKDSGLKVTSVELWGHSKAYTNHPNSVKAVKTFTMPEALWNLSGEREHREKDGITALNADAPSGTNKYEDSSLKIIGVFNARTLMNNIKTYGISDDNSTFLSLRIEPKDAVSGQTIHYITSVGLRSTELGGVYDLGESGPDIPAISFSMTYDNSPTKSTNVEFFQSMQDIGQYSYRTDDILYSADLANSKLLELTRAYKVGNLLYDLRADGAVYFQNYTITEPQYSPFIMGLLTEAGSFEQTNYSISNEELFRGDDFNSASVNYQIPGGATIPHYEYSPEFPVEYISGITAQYHEWGYNSFTWSAFRRLSHVPINGMAGHINPERRHLRISTPNGTSSNLRQMQLVLNEFTNPYVLVTNAAGNTDGRWIDVAEGKTQAAFDEDYGTDGYHNFS
tara:strand:- start:324 stop:1616 length:1293 start_codon:yes stop_codon:yes gene_type:complete